ncbi:MAG: TIGR01777 family protein [Flavobacteriaceae bacterium]|nr:TIGR01777 family protein [Flavobacteriaceae bacterium]MBL6678459.1 TIGR01777 family protein [Flavobacteriaceae bacterium]
MKVLITGGSGTLGKEIANLVFKKKYEVNILTRNKNLKSHNPQLKYYYWNPKKEDIDLNCFNNVDCIINLAGFSVFNLWTKTNKTKIIDSRVGSTNFILDVILKKNIKIKSFVNASAIAAYRDSSDFTSSEKDSINNPNSFINQVVLKWEGEVKKFESKLPDISFSIMRIGLVLSKSGGLYKMCKMLSKLFILSPIGSGNQWQSWIHEKDAAKIILSSCENSWRGTYNLVAPNPVKQNELINKIAIFNNSKVIFPNIPSIIIKLVFGKMSEIILSSQKVKSIKLSESDFSFKHIDDALKDLSKNI